MNQNTTISEAPSPQTTIETAQSPSTTTPATTAPPVWTNDFVLLAEFSEQLGPVSLWTLPETPPSATASMTSAQIEQQITAGFETQKFLSSMMAVDYQSRHGATAAFSEDTRVVTADPQANLTYYAYHFTLLDVHARGYVRPLLFAYITRDSSLILDHYEEFSSLFAAATMCLKRKNKRITQKDLSHRIQDLKYTQSLLEKAGNSTAEELSKLFPSGAPKFKLQSLKDHLIDLEQLKSKIESIPNQPSPPSELFQLTSEDDSEKNNSSSSSSSFDDDVNDQKGKEEEDKYEPTTVLYVHKGQFDKPLRGIDGLCGYKTVIKVKGLIERIITKFSRQIALRVLSELVNHNNNNNNSNTNIDDSLMRLKIGNAICMNFCIDLPQNLRISGDFPPGLNSALRNKQQQQKEEEHKLKEQAKTPAMTTSTSDEASISLSVIKKQMEAPSTITTELTSTSTTNDNSNQNNTTTLIEEEKVDEQFGSFPRTSPCRLSQEETKEDPNIATSLPVSTTTPNKPKSPHSISPISITDFSRSSKILKEQEMLDGLWVSLQQQQQQQQQQSSIMIPTNGCNSIREFVQRFEFCRHIVYSLLRGRPVILRASPSNQDALASIIDVLSIFVAGNPTKAIEHWRTTTIYMSDLAKLRLVGVSSRVLLPKAVERSATLFLFEEKVRLLAPPCPQGSQFVDEILALRKTWLDDESYLAHIHEVLYSISSKAFLYYHMCCASISSFISPLEDAINVASAQRSLAQSQQRQNVLDPRRSPRTQKSLLRNGIDPLSPKIKPSTPIRRSSTSPQQQQQQQQQQKQTNTGSELISATIAELQNIEKPLYSMVPVQREVRDNSRLKFFSELGIHSGDREIIEYLAEVVKQQQASEFPSCTQVIPVKVDRSAVQLFPNNTEQSHSTHS